MTELVCVCGSVYMLHILHMHVHNVCVCCRYLFVSVHTCVYTYIQYVLTCVRARVCVCTYLCVYSSQFHSSTEPPQAAGTAFPSLRIQTPANVFPRCKMKQGEKERERERERVCYAL